MRNKLYKILAAGFALALAFTFGCSSGDDGDGGGSCVGGTVKIGTQTWHKCNLNVVPSEGNSACYDNKPENCGKYGRLYDWEAAMSACPSGFHLPTTEEWDILVAYAGGTSVAGDKLKARSGWKAYEGESGNGTDSYGFVALPGGSGVVAGSYAIFRYVGELGSWWSATEEDASNAYHLFMSIGAAASYLNSSKILYHSVRCLED